jgi:hypothetical protein
VKSSLIASVTAMAAMSGPALCLPSPFAPTTATPLVPWTVEEAGLVRQGTCGWSDESLIKCGRFYPPSRPSTHKLGACVVYPGRRRARAQSDIAAQSSFSLSHKGPQACFSWLQACACSFSLCDSAAQSDIVTRLYGRVAEHYSRCGLFSCVEVDSSTYAIPSPATVKGWCDQVPSGFVFHIKAFGLFCSQSVPLNALPRAVREMPSMSAIGTGAGAGAGGRRVSGKSMGSDALDATWQRFNEVCLEVQQRRKMGMCIFQFQVVLPQMDTRNILCLCVCLF